VLHDRDHPSRIILPVIPRPRKVRSRIR
jgi:hypothetical protein